jgi:predicted ArsR family transcriptional regulator
MTGRSGDYHAALASPSRRQVLDVLRDSPTPLDAGAVAAQLGLHLTTARFHLDQLAAAGLAHRRAGAEKRRGRPRMLYSPAGPLHDEDSREQLIRVLATALAGQDDHTASAVRAGRRWAASLVPAAESPVAGLVEVLERLGFDPDPDPDESQILLRSCPFRDAAREHPEVVCAVHRGLVEQLLDRTAPHAQLLPFVEPELCVVALDRTSDAAASRNR